MSVDNQLFSAAEIQGLLDSTDDRSVTPVSDGVDALTDDTVDFLCGLGFPPTSPTHESSMIGPCDGCDYLLHWPAPTAGQWASPIACPGCGRWYFAQGVKSESSRAGSTENTPGRQHQAVFRSQFTLRQIACIDALFTQLLGPDRYFGGERRQTARQACSLPVVVVPLDKSAHPIGDAVEQTMLNVSTGGVGLLGAEPLEAELVLIDFTKAGAQGQQLLAKVAWSDTRHGVTKTGCSFLHAPSSAKSND